MELIVLLILGVLLFFYFKYKKKKLRNTVRFLNPEQRAILVNQVVYYQKLDKKKQQYFEDRIVEFLNEVQILPYGFTLETADTMLIAASAIIPVFGFKNWKYHNLKTIYLFPDAFNTELHYVGNNNGRTILGMVGHGKLKDKMILSKKALHHGFENTTDKKNTAIHEFVHLIDMMDGEIDGLPKIIEENPFLLPWFDLMHHKIAAIDKGKSDINSYGAVSKIEFLAVASEYFFERPKLLKRKHPELYKSLSSFFSQDLAQPNDTNL